MCAPRVTRHTSNISNCQKKYFFSFSVTVNNSIKVGALVFLFQMFVITENIMKRPAFGVIIQNVYRIVIVLIAYL